MIPVPGKAFFILAEGLVQKCTIQVEGEVVKAEDWFNKYAESRPYRSPRLPDYCVKYIVRNGAEAGFLLQYPPAVRRISCEDKWRLLSFPYTLLFAIIQGDNLESGHAYFSNVPYGTRDIDLYVPGLSNIDTEGGVCMGTADIISGAPHLVAADFARKFWNSGFNKGGSQDGIEYARARNPKLASYEKWEEESARDPNFILDQDWLKSDVTVHGILDKYYEDGCI
jgi:hypothetical protein